MTRIIIKGGVWKNTEDEVLKAAIAKYGKNQWARISSLLVRKTPKQCKARWYEWLDPSIKKTEWSKAEDEKLLHLAKLMPTQWRTIAPIVGRTATQCLERYQKLLDEAEAKENEEMGLSGPGAEAGPSSEDVRKLRPGEIDPDPETKPARPDPIDMDEDEKEMLSEARARLANTQGKKAKRKARERQLEEARRLAMLQKRRELKAAGIMSSMRSLRKNKGIDYNADIPFEKKPAAGFYDTSEEQAKEIEAPIGQSLKRLEFKRKPEDDDAERRKRQRKDDELGNQTKFIAARDAQIQKLKEAEQISKRRKLQLPDSQVGEAELEEIVKIGQAGRIARDMVDDGNEASSGLLDEHNFLETKSVRTPRTAQVDDVVMNEARNLRNMTIQQTPLLGDENTPLRASANGGTGFEGSTPRHNAPFTPNPLATPRGDATSTGSTPLRTPMRDTLSLNRALADDTPRSQKHLDSMQKRVLRQGFQSLPKPENNFELLVPEDATEGEEESALSREDAADRDAREKKLQDLHRQRELARRSSALRLNLPRPAYVDLEALLQGLEQDSAPKAHSQVDLEMAQLILHDSVTHPLPGTHRAGSQASQYDYPQDNYVEQARSAVHRELALSIGYPAATEEQVRQGLAALANDDEIEATSSWGHLKASLVFDPSKASWVESSGLDEADRVACLTGLLERQRESMTQDASKVAKAERKLGVTLGGYQKRSETLSARLMEAFTVSQQAYAESECFSRLRDNELEGGARRVLSLEEDVRGLADKEKRLQERFKELEFEKSELEASLALLEERVLAEAEAMNEAVMTD